LELPSGKLQHSPLHGDLAAFEALLGARLAGRSRARLVLGWKVDVRKLRLMRMRRLAERDARRKDRGRKEEEARKEEAVLEEQSRRWSRHRSPLA
jgi:hypothetical protein